MTSSGGGTSLVSSFAASYQIDLWGKNRAAYKSAQDTATANRWNRQTVQLTELASVANTYFNVLAARERVRYARQDIVDSSRILKLIEDREKAGTATALNVAQQAALVANLRASIPPLEVIADQNVIALGILLGRTPQRVFVKGTSVLDGTVAAALARHPVRGADAAPPTSNTPSRTSPPPTPTWSRRAPPSSRS